MLLHVAGAIVYVIYLLAPGLIVCYLLNFRRNRFFFAYGFGITVLVLSQIPFRLWGGQVIHWYLLVHAIYLIVLIGALAVRKKAGRPKRRSSNQRIRSSTVGLIGIVGGFITYHLLVGPYTEIPSDFWARLGDVTEQLVLIKSGRIASSSNISQLLDDTAYIPFLHAAVSRQFSVLPLYLVNSATLITSLLFLVATYWFTLWLVASLRINARRKVAIAFLAVAMTLITFGVATFSYVRYYAYFPHIVNAVLMLAAIVFYLDYLERGHSKFINVITVAVLVFVMAVINQQEALMVMIVLAAISVWKWLKSLRKCQCMTKLETSRSKLMGCLMLGVSIAVLSLGFIVGKPGSGGAPHLVNLGEVIPFLDGWLVANPTLRVWDTIGFMGVVVYVWYFLRRRWFKGLDYINVAMISPVFLLFNPLFVLWFLYVASWDPLWRMAYLVPLPIVSAILVVRLFDLRSAGHTSFRGMAIDMPFIALLVLSLLPFQVPFINNDNSRLPSLASVHQSNGALLWNDLIRYFEGLEGNQDFVTDSVTNYVLSTTFTHNGLPRPKESWQRGRNFFEGNYQDKLLYYGMDDKLLVINNKDGALSVNGKLSGHWPSDILKVSKTYPPDLIEFLDSRPLDYRLMWQNDGIRVYRILRDPAHYD